MATRKKTKTQRKPQYVRAGKRKGESSTVARRSLTIGMLVVVLAGIAFGIMQGFSWIGSKLFSANPRFEIQHLEISCDGKLSEELIREYTGLREGTNLWAVSFAEIKANLVKAPVVESVYLERILPHTLIIKVRERIPVARISGLESSRLPYLTDRNGVVLAYRRSAAALPLIKGLEIKLRPGDTAEHPDVFTALRIIALSDSSPYVSKHVHIESLDVKYSDFIDMRLKGGTRVRIPRFSLVPKLQNLATVIKIATGQGRRAKEVDLTLDSDKVPVTYY